MKESIMTVQNDSEARGGTLTQTPGTGARRPGRR